MKNLDYDHPITLRQIIDSLNSSLEETYGVIDRIISSRLDEDLSHEDQFFYIFKRCRSLQENKLKKQYFIDQENNLGIIHIIRFVSHMIESKTQQESDIIILLKSMCAVQFITRQNETRYIIKYHGQLPQLQLILNKNIDINNYQECIRFWCMASELEDNIIQQVQKIEYSIKKIPYIGNLILESVEKELIQNQQSVYCDPQFKSEKQTNILNNSKLQSKGHKIPNIEKLTKQTLQLHPNGDIIRQNGKYLHFNKFNSILNQLALEQAFYQGGLDDYNKPSGPGIIFSQSQQIAYKGVFKNGLFHGQGEIFIQGEKIYEGAFVNGLRHGRGIQFHNKISLQGEFYYDRKSGTFFVDQKEVIFQNDVEVYEQPSSTVTIIDKSQIYQQKIYKTDNPSNNLYFSGQSSINNHILNSLSKGKWLNQSIVDYYLHICFDFYKIIRKDFENKIIFIDTAQFQDIFGSMLCEQKSINFSCFQKIILDQFPITQKTLVFGLNLDQSHFLTVVIEKLQYIYIIDSIKGNRKVLINLIQKLLIQMDKSLKFKVITDISVSQQMNGYDCGVYTCYYIQQLFKHIAYNDLSIIENANLFQVNQEQIDLFRIHVQNTIENNYAKIEL
ncbi:hypothetical protein pb186bvf_004810 [Paramecium bursaria]